MASRDVDVDVQPMEDPERELERTLIAEFIRARGLTPEDLDRLPAEERSRLLADASIHAAGKLAEVEARAHFVRGVHEARKDDGTGRLP
jgi:hypothetical protein